jgi:hypothetical protein
MFAVLKRYFDLVPGSAPVRRFLKENPEIEPKDPRRKAARERALAALEEMFIAVMETESNKAEVHAMRDQTAAALEAERKEKIRASFRGDLRSFLHAVGASVAVSPYPGANPRPLGEHETFPTGAPLFILNGVCTNHAVVRAAPMDYDAMKLPKTVSWDRGGIRHGVFFAPALHNRLNGERVKVLSGAAYHGQGDDVALDGLRWVEKPNPDLLDESDHLPALPARIVDAVRVANGNNAKFIEAALLGE